VIDKLKELAISSLTYGIGNYGIKLVNFMLIPVYTRFLNPGDYGVMSLVSAFGQALFIFLNLGQSTALFFFYYEKDDPAARERVVAGSLWVTLLCSMPLTIVVLLLSGPTAKLLLGDGVLYPLVAIGTLTVACRQLLRLPFAVLRAKKKDKAYATWSIIRTALSAGLAILLVVGIKMGVNGVLLSALIGEAIMCAVMVPMIAGALRTGWAGTQMWSQLSYGLWLVPGGVASFVLDLSDRFFLKHWSGIQDVGVYSLGYRFGEIIFFIVAAVQLAWPQFVLSNQRAEKAPELYSYATTYYLLAMAFLILGLSVFAPEILTVMAAPAFHRAASVVPVIALAGLCEGLCYVSAIGIIVFRKPMVRSAAVAIGAIVNTGFNLILIRPYGMMGAAWATLFGFAAQTAFQVVASLRYYPVPYQWARFGILTGVSVGLYLTSTVVSGPLPVAIAAKLGLVLSFPFLLWLLGFFEEAELQQVQRLRAGVLKRLVPSRA
jgi:O-antigen/teichoic acid export membrane protein